jgi:hypothetical protein
MPQLEEESAPPPDPLKTLVRGSDGELYVVQKNAITGKLTPQQKDYVETVILQPANDQLTAYLNQSGSPSLASGVRIRITEAF